MSVIMQEHLAHDCMEKLGAAGAVQFTDLNGDMTAFKRFYTPFIKRCDELEKKLRFFEDEIRVHGIVIDPVSAGELTVWRAGQVDTVNREHRGMTLLEYWEAIVSERHRDYQAIKGERDKTVGILYQAVQRRFVIEKAAEFFVVERDADVAAGGSAAAAAAAAGAGTGIVNLSALEAGRAPAGGRVGGSNAASSSSAAADDSEDMVFKHIAGLVSTEDKVRFSRIIFRASFGQAVVRFADIPVDLLDEKGVPHAKSVFAVFFRGRSLAHKLDRICAAFSASVHDIPNFARESEVMQALEETRDVIRDSMGWLDQERATSGAALAALAVLVRKWRMGVQREKAIYHAMNMGVRVPERGALEAQGWVLKTQVATAQEAIRSVHVAAAAGGRVQPYYFEVLKDGSTGNSASTSAPAVLPAPPTHFHTNKFTKAFQGFVNTYGVPRYGEANPALWAIVTFPFLFGVMYGDIGHASILTLASAWVVWSEESLGKRKLGEMFGMVFKGRYMLLMMGCFSIYCGAIYNDVFSLGASPHKTAWTYLPKSREATWSGKPEDVYPFGIDPEWHMSENDLLFFNSLKMKLSVILGITQMTFGLILKTSNALHFKNKLDLFCECIPQLVFMVGLFGYMIALIVLKWSIDWRDPASRPGASPSPISPPPRLVARARSHSRPHPPSSPPPLAGAPPSLIDTMINIALKPGTVSDGMYAGQANFQMLLLLIVFICVPVMLCIKPIVLHKRNQAAHAHHEEEVAGLLQGTPHAAAGTDASSKEAGGHEQHVAHHAPAPAAGGGHEAHGFGELFIHQAIETIEFVLGSVSNTASYLRLWALSLAHSQLATVFWERAFVVTVEMNSTLFVIIGFGAFAVISCGVLMIMDVLECYLHALRLHWVEFQNKVRGREGGRRGREVSRLVAPPLPMSRCPGTNSHRPRMPPLLLPPPPRPAVLQGRRVQVHALLLPGHRRGCQLRLAEPAAQGGRGPPRGRTGLLRGGSRAEQGWMVGWNLGGVRPRLRVLDDLDRLCPPLRPQHFPQKLILHLARSVAGQPYSSLPTASMTS